jgi:hypothetical protein
MLLKITWVLSYFALLIALGDSPQPASQRTKAHTTRTNVVLLGTGTPVPDPDRSGPATAIVVNDRAYLIDFGPGVVRRAKAAVHDRNMTALEPANLTSAFAANDLHRGNDANSLARKCFEKHRYNIRVFVWQKLRTVLQNGDPTSETAVRLGKLQTDIAAADHNQMLGQAIQFEQFNIGERPGFREARDRRN